MFSESPVDQWTDLILALDMPDYFTTFSGKREKRECKIGRKRERERERNRERERERRVRRGRK